MGFPTDKPVLVVEDHAAMAEVIRSLLIRLGFGTVDVASDGSQALAMLERRPYGLVISDWDMRPVTGYDLLRRMRATREMGHIHFIMMSADGEPERRALAEAAGAQRYLPKPFTAAQLQEAVAAAFAR
jgi:two-component system chemotaxis response regulator CheY